MRLLHTIKEIIKKIVGDRVLLFYHQCVAVCAVTWYRHPSREMLVIGVTGTNGKSTTCHLISRVLEETGYKVGMCTTAEFKIGKKVWLNDTKMTMLGRFALQKFLRRMANAGVNYAVIEVSSQGVLQHRIDGIDFDIALFTNLTPEHIEAHGGFLNYKKEKGRFFAHLSKTKRKYSLLHGDMRSMYCDNSYDTRSADEKICKTIIVNADDPHADYFETFDADEKYCFGIEGKPSSVQDDQCRIVRATKVALHPLSTEFEVGSSHFSLSLPGMYNIYNALAAITVGLTRGMDFSTIVRALSGVLMIPGRFEVIDEGQNFKVIVDYAPEPESMRELYRVIDALEKKRVIHVLGSCGGGRDKARRKIMGQLAGEHADIVIVTNEDPYDDPPQEIIDEVFSGARSSGKHENENVFRILDRKEAIARAFSLATEGDIVLLTGKGAEQMICVAGGKKIPWDEREVARELLRKK